MLKNKSALITGANRGIGFSILERIAENGANIIACARKQDDLFEKKISNISKKFNIKIKPIYFDLSNENEIEQGLKKIISLNWIIDIIVNNAGILKVGKAEEFSIKDFQDILQVNVLAPFQIISGIVGGMKRKKFGRIVNISSIWGEKSKSGRSIYSTSKAALNALTRSFAVEFAEHNILVNSIAPGYIETDMMKQYNSEKELDIIKNSIPMKRFGKKTEISELVKFLCSEKNSYITGQILTIDGGFACK